MKKIITFVVMAAMAVSASAQEKVSSLTIGFSPLGATHMTCKAKKLDIDNSYDWKSNWNVNIGYERQFKGAVSLTELTYFQGKFDKYKFNSGGNSYTGTTGDDIYSAGVTTYIGTTILGKQSRVQFPVFIGVGAEYINNDAEIHHLFFDLAAKARLKFYITSSIGIYAGATYRYGFGIHKEDNGSSSSDSSNSVAISPSTWAVDAGLVIGL